MVFLRKNFNIDSTEIMNYTKTAKLMLHEQSKQNRSVTAEARDNAGNPIQDRDQNELER